MKWTREARRGEKCERRRGPTAARAALASLLLAAGCTAPQLGADDERLGRVPEAQLAPLATRVEAVRGLRFLRPVVGWLVPRAGLRALLERELSLSLSPAEMANDAELAASLGLIPAGLDLRALVLAFQEENAAGFYSLASGRLYLVEGAASAGSPDSDALAVHELAHALQAQRAPLALARLGLRGDDDLAFALTAWMEGEATFVELADAEAHSGARRPAPATFAAQFPGAREVPELPLILAAQVLEPYPLGYALADALFARGGVGALDAAHGNPPLTSEELLHPERYLSAPREPLAELAREPSLRGCRVLSTNSFGELAVRSWLEARGSSVANAASAAAGWDADRAWRLGCGAGAASAWLLATESEGDARELESALLAQRALADGLRISREGKRVLVADGLDDERRAALLALPEPREFHDVSEYLAAHPEVMRRARRAQR